MFRKAGNGYSFQIWNSILHLNRSFRKCTKFLHNFYQFPLITSIRKLKTKDHHIFKQTASKATCSYAKSLYPNSGLPHHTIDRAISFHNGCRPFSPTRLAYNYLPGLFRDNNQFDHFTALYNNRLLVSNKESGQNKYSHIHLSFSIICCRHGLYKVSKYFYEYPGIQPR